MQLNEKISFFRNLKGFSQEEMAEKMGMSLNGYAKIERGETDVQVSRLERICTVLGVNLQDLFAFNEQMIFNSSFDNSNQTNYIEAAKGLINDLKTCQKEVEYLKQQVTDLRKINELLEDKLSHDLT